MVTDRDEQLQIVKVCHEGTGDSAQAKALGGHLGRDKTRFKITERFYWPTITADVGSYVQSCDTCQRVNKTFKKSKGEMQPIAVQPEAFQRIGIDLVGPLPVTRDGYKYFATAICAYTKWVESEPLKDKCAITVAQFIYRIICRHGCFEIQISDQGREFVNQVSEELHKLTGVQHRMTSAYHPQCNGLAEKQNQTTQNMLLKYLDNKDEWADILDSVLFAYRTSRHASTGYSPFFLLYGRHPRLPVELMLEDANMADTFEVMEKIRMTSLGNARAPQGETSSADKSKYKANDDTSVVGDDTNICHNLEENIAQQKKQKLDVSEKVMQNIQKAQKHQKKGFDKRSNPTLYTTGDGVLLQEVKNQNRAGGKLDTRFTGPYEICDEVRPGVYRLKRNGKAIKKSINASRLKRYVRRTEESSTSNCILQDEEDIQILQSQSGWLTDKHMNAASKLLLKEHPNNGLQDTLLQQNRSHEVPDGEYVQFMHVDGCHWITISNIGKSKMNEIDIFDSLCHRPSNDALQKILQFHHHIGSNVNLRCMNVKKQENGNDCGVLAIAYATSLLNGQDPTQLEYTNCREHLLKCFKEGKISMFPAKPEMKNPVIEEFTVDLVCQCRGMEDGAMIQCIICNKKYHHRCINVRATRSAKWRCLNCQ